MYPTLRIDADRATWIDKTATELQEFADHNRTRLDEANRRGQFPRDLYAEVGAMSTSARWYPKNRADWVGALPNTS